MNDWIPDNTQVAGNGAHGASKDYSSLSVPLANQGCLYNDERCYGCGNRKGYRNPKRARVTTDFEADFLQEEMKKLSIKKLQSSELAVLGDCPDESKILNRGNGQLEEPAFTSIKFSELDSTIQVLVENRYGFGEESPGILAYKLALDQNKAYVDNAQFKIGFLRAERYDPKKAAYRMLRYFEEKHELFGTEKLTKKISLEDLGEDGRRYLDIGNIQILPERDKAGRLVFCMTHSFDDEEVEAMRLGIRKGYFYMLNYLAEGDSEVGRIKGFVSVDWRFHKLKAPNPAAFNFVSQSFLCSPTKVAAFHVCRSRVATFDLEHLNNHSKLLLPFLKNVGMIQYLRSHYGTAQECKYTLLKYGCPDCLPLKEEINNTSNTSPFHIRYHKVWMAQRIANGLATKQGLLTMSNSFDGCVHPNDVIIGNHPSLRNHPGNIQFRELVADNFDRYCAPNTSKRQKTTVAEEIAWQIKVGGGRFLKQTENDKGALWVEASDVEARNKVAITFRSIVKRDKRREGRRLVVPNDTTSLFVW